jgi:hypothetical protein
MDKVILSVIHHRQNTFIGLWDVEDLTFSRQSAHISAGRALPHKKIPDTHLCVLCQLQGHSAAGTIRQIEKKFYDLIGTWAS